MHGRPRKAKPSAQETEADRVARVEAKAKKAKKAELFSRLCARVLGARASGSYDPGLLTMSEKLVEMNPEMYTVWNYRRAYLEPVLAGGGDGAVDAAGRELEVTARALMQNPKSYSTFHHRRWVVSQGYCSLEKEVGLVEGLLDVDARNFHGWGYRRWVVGLMGMERGRELAYSRRKIEENFSNYSAWHHRSVVFGRFGLGWEEAGAELGFVRQACYTDPGDQSGWFYHRWLIGKLMAGEVQGEVQGEHGEVQGEHCADHHHHNNNNDKDDDLVDILEREVAMCRDVHGLDGDTKWPVLIARGLVRHLEGLGWVEGDGRELTGWLEGKDGAWLAGVDPMRSGFYKDDTCM